MTSYAIISSNKDNASKNIKQALIESYRFTESEEIFEQQNVFKKDNLKIYTTNNELVYLENVDKYIDADYFVFASKHQSKSKIPSLTVHSIGNWGIAELGGKDSTLVSSSALLQRDLFLNLNKFSQSFNYEVVNEATHHGPFLKKPSIFIEIGSSDKEWNDKNIAFIVAKVIIETLKSDRNKASIAVGIGGLHTCSNFNRIILKNNVAIAHFCAKHSLNSLNKEMIKEALNKTIERVDFLLLDWKGLKSEKQRILNEINELRIEYKRTDNF